MSAPAGRIDEISSMRAIAFLAVVLQHVIATLQWLTHRLDTEMLPVTALLITSRFAVPVFVFITGFLTVGSLARTSLPQYARKRIQTVVWPYLVWSLVYYVYWKRVHGAPLELSGKQLGEFATTALRGSAQYHLWFVAMIVQIYLVVPFLAPLFAKLRERFRSPVSSWAFVGAFVALHIGVLATYADPLPPVLRDAPALPGLWALRYQLFPLWLIYAVLGMVAAAHYARIRRALLSRMGLWIVAAWAVYSVLLVAGLAETIAQQGGYRAAADFSDLFAPRMFPYAVISIAALFVCSHGLLRFAAAARCLEVISEHSYVGYLAHPLVLSLLSWRGDKERLDWPGNPMLIALILFACVVTTSVMVCRLLARLPRSLRLAVSGR